MFFTKVSGTGSYLPEKVVTNFDLQQQVETTNEWILERTGIAERRVANAEQATSDLALIAARRALEAAGLRPEDLDAILVGTTTPDQIMPNTACVIQSELKCRSIMALDMLAACSGFLYAMSIADQFIKTGMYRHILVIGAETLSRIVDFQDRQTCILFGDGAAAFVLSRSDETSSSRIFSSHLHAQGDLGYALTLPGGGSRLPLSQAVIDERLHMVKMNGREIFKAAVQALVHRCKEALTANQMSIEDVDWFVLHQANIRIIDAVADTLKVPREKLLINIAETGNTSSASIPLLFDQSLRAGKIRRGQNVLFAAFGGGLTSASILFRY